ncbi:MAG: L-aspartate oxidase [Candidatus Pelagibacterales bacterium]|jgi:L-aspartate oxidase|tara:strand:+ start:5870 stop:7489 length:1620 start_codon:yes stop_codon:yes gene_type:complete
MTENIYTPDVVVVGGGVAGLTVALNLAPRKVCVITKSNLGINTSSSWSQAGIAASIDKDDSLEIHLKDTLKTAKGLANEAVAKKIISESFNVIKDLENIGVKFDKNSDGSFNLGLEAAHSHKRIVGSKGDSSGIEIMRGLINEVKQSEHITVLENVSIDSIMHENNTIYGVIGRFTDKNMPDNHVIIQSSHIVLATGGLGGIYANTTNPRSSYGEGIALAAEVGAILTDMEFVQFHPTGLDFGLDPTPLATEAIRGAGAFLVNQNNDRFMLSAHPDAELAPRDIIAQNIFKQIDQGNSVFLDCRDTIGDNFKSRFPQVHSYCVKAEIDPAKDLMPIIPVAHYHIGGVKTDITGRTSVDGLWCCGEVAATGVHGANRLASNSLLEALVFGKIVANEINSQPFKQEQQAINSNFLKTYKEKTRSKIRAKKYIWQLRSTMMRHLGIVRNETSILKGLSEIIRIERDSKGLSAKLNDMILVSKFIIVGAIKRTESRGCHLRFDYPNADPKFLNHIDQTQITMEQDIESILLEKDLPQEKTLAS